MKRTRRSGSNRNLKLMLLAAVATFATAFGIVGYATNLLQTLEGQTVDTRFTVRGTERVPKNIVIVNVDSSTIQDLSKFQWPFPRAADGQVLNHIASEHPAAIAFDIQLSEASQLGQDDEIALLNDISNYPNKMVFANTQPLPGGNVQFLGSGQGAKLLRSVGSQPAESTFPIDPGGILRHMQYSIDGLTTLPVVTAEVASHKRVRPFKGQKWIDFIGPAGTFPSLSYSQVYYNTRSGQKTGTKLPANYFRGKIVIVGASAPVLQDIHAVSTDPAMPGPELHANAIYTVLRGFPLSSDAGWINVVLIVLMGVAVPLASTRVRPVVSIVIAVALAAAFSVAVQLAFNSGAVVSYVYPIGALILSAVGSLAVQLVTEAFERIRTVDLFARFVPDSVVDEVLKSADGLRLGGIQRAGTVMFTDLRGFTSFSESLTPSQVIDVLNHYLSEMSDAILDNGGTLVAYMGDGIFAVFGAPLEMPDHADRALRAAREMLTNRLPRFNQWIRDQGLGDGFRMGIGLNSGNVMSGHVGSERRVEYAAVGDTTNTASRIESLTKGTPHQLLLSDSTRDALTEPAEDLVFFDDVEIRGRVARMTLWGLNEDEPDKPASPEAAAQTPA